MHPFSSGGTASDSMDGTYGHGHSFGICGMEVNIVAHIYVGVTESAAATGVELSRETAFSRAGRPIAVRTVCAFVYSVPAGQNEAEPTINRVDKFGENKDNKETRVKGSKSQKKNGIETREKRQKNMGVISCRSMRGLINPKPGTSQSDHEMLPQYHIELQATAASGRVTDAILMPQHKPDTTWSTDSTKYC